MERPQPSLPLALLLLASSAPPSVAWAAAKTPVTHEALWLMKRVGAPVPSPDGRWVVFSVTEPAYDPKDQTADLWIVPADGSARPRKLTFSKSDESYPTWSPDSRRIAFTRREGEEAAQIYVLDIAGGGEAAAGDQSVDGRAFAALPSRRQGDLLHQRRSPGRGGR